jgi:hypothetical protein
MFQKSSYKNRAITWGPKSLKLLYSIRKSKYIKPRTVVSFVLRAYWFPEQTPGLPAPTRWLVPRTKPGRSTTAKPPVSRTNLGRTTANNHSASRTNPGPTLAIRSDPEQNPGPVAAKIRWLVSRTNAGPTIMPTRSY